MLTFQRPDAHLIEWDSTHEMGRKRKNLSLQDVAIKVLDTKNEDGDTYKEAIIKVMTAKAIQGDKEAGNIVFELTNMTNSNRRKDKELELKEKELELKKQELELRKLELKRRTCYDDDAPSLVEQIAKKLNEGRLP